MLSGKSELTPRHITAPERTDAGNKPDAVSTLFQQQCQPHLKQPKVELQMNHLMNAAKVNRKLLYSVIISAVAGYLVIFLPWWLSGSRKNMIDGMHPSSLLLLVLLGLGCTLAVPNRLWITGLASIALLPAIAIIQAVLDPSSHNLLGLELILYLFFTVPVFVGGGVAKLIMRLRARGHH